MCGGHAEKDDSSLENYPRLRKTRVIEPCGYVGEFKCPEKYFERFSCLAGDLESDSPNFGFS